MKKCKFYKKCKLYSKDGVTCNEEAGFYSGLKKAGCYHHMEKNKERFK